MKRLYGRVPGTAVSMAPRVAAIMAAELGRDAAWAAAQVESFTALARSYLPG